ncbi:hypothetical protein J6590_092758 [Homalodisca vitripennis]|nr:hypothetical protein J6590_092758 [Homalodisca vitripennis]
MFSEGKKHIIQAPRGRPTGCQAIRRFKVHAITVACGRRAEGQCDSTVMASGSSNNPFLCDGSFTVSSEDQEKLTRFLYEHGILQRTALMAGGTCLNSITTN